MGEDDTDSWDQLFKVRKEIDALSEEKIQWIKKMFALTQRFVQEAQIQNEEQNQSINLEKTKAGGNERANRRE